MFWGVHVANGLQRQRISFGFQQTLNINVLYPDVSLSTRPLWGSPNTVTELELCQRKIKSLIEGSHTKIIWGFTMAHAHDHRGCQNLVDFCRHLSF